jgi:hypothetical protein
MFTSNKYGLFVSVIIVYVLLLPLSANAQIANGSSRFSISPELSFLNGSTDYEIDANAFDPNATDSVSRIRSLLEFPLDVTLVGATVKYSFGGADHIWTATASLNVSISDPSDLMTDKDWIDGVPVSYTESNAEASIIFLSGHVSRRMLTRERYTVALFAGLDYRRIEQDIIGFDGWQDLDRNGVRSPIRGDDTAVIYEVTYLSPEAGLRADVNLSGSFDFATAISTGLVIASDSDDHLLRGIKSEGDGIGIAIGATGELRLRPAVSAMPGFWIGVFGGVRYHYAEGNVTKTWYRDAGSVPAGTVDPDIPYTFESMQTSIGLRLGVDL